MTSEYEYVGDIKASNLDTNQKILMEIAHKLKLIADGMNKK